RGIAQCRMPVGRADRDIVHPVLERLVHRQDARAGEAVDRRHHRRVDESRKGMGGGIGLGVDQVEAARPLEEMREMGIFPHLRVELGILRIAAGHHAIERARSDRIARGEQRHFDSARDQRLGKQARHQFPG
ncbi:hypothetical protein QU40_00130, partial [Staphylococcus aureus]